MTRRVLLTLGAGLALACFFAWACESPTEPPPAGDYDLVSLDGRPLPTYWDTTLLRDSTFPAILEAKLHVNSDTSMTYAIWDGGATRHSDGTVSTVMSHCIGNVLIGYRQHADTLTVYNPTKGYPTLWPPEYFGGSPFFVVEGSDLVLVTAWGRFRYIHGNAARLPYC